MKQYLNLAAILYRQGSKESFGSCYSSAGEEHLGKINVTGEISFSLSFDYKSNIFQVHVKQCRDLAAADHKKQRSDPLVDQWIGMTDECMELFLDDNHDDESIMMPVMIMMVVVFMRMSFISSYVKSYLLPDKTKNGKRKTKVKKNTLNPVFEEVLKVKHKT